MDCPGGGKPNGGVSPPGALDETGRHPCFSFEAHHKYARMHLPVAPNCNISCNYCNRKYDCLHESRPGVTSEVLSPESALQKYIIVRSKVPNLSVIGVAGPGDALANWENTERSLKLIKQADPEIIFCLSTNGLVLTDYARKIAGLGVRHVTVTVNCLDPEIGERIYHHVNYRGKTYRGALGAGILIYNQLAGIEALVMSGVVVKVNIVVIKGVNDSHIPEIVKKVKDLGAFMTNIMPLIPAGGSVFEDFPRPDQRELNRLRKICQSDLRQMYHCRQCRADAIGLLGEDRSLEFLGALDAAPPLKAAGAT